MMIIHCQSRNPAPDSVANFVSKTNRSKEGIWTENLLTLISRKIWMLEEFQHDNGYYLVGW